MKSFNYHSAKDSKEASKLSSSNSAFLAGGMTTIPSMKLGLASYKDIIDIKNIKKESLDFDIVVIATPEDTHYKIIKYFISIFKETKKKKIISAV